jgi:thymidylate synthase (FAD)
MELLTPYNLARDTPEIMHPIGVLDSGFVQLVDWNGSDQRIVDAARVSYEGAKQVLKDNALIDYLMRHGHWSPFEMVDMTFRFKMPLFVVAQIKRYRTAKMNEQSGRYVQMHPEFHVPYRLRKQDDKKNKQGSDGELSDELNTQMIQAMRMQFDSAFATYQELLDAGVAREQAREVLPVSTYTSFMWKMDARNLFGLLQARLDSHAQPETQAYAIVIAHLMSKVFPVAYEAFEEHSLGSVKFGRTEARMFRTFVSEFPEARDWFTNACNIEGFRRSRREEFLNKIFAGGNSE